MRAAVAIVLVLGAAAGASAQTPAPRPLPRVELDLGAGLLGGAGAGSADANLRANDPARQPFRLFSTESRFARAPEFHVRAGLPLNPRLTVEGGLTVSRPDLSASISQDVEDAPPLTVSERIDQYFIDASVVFMLPELQFGSVVPFAAAGAGYLRQLHEGQTLVEHGQVFHAGGGLKYWLLARAAGFVRAAGVRGDARAYFMREGVSFEARPRPHMAISGSVFVGF